MINILLIGDTQNIEYIIENILVQNQGTCLHEKSIFNAIKTLYSKKIDAVIISSREVHEDKIGFIQLLKEKFMALKVFISYDNGLSTLTSMPDSIELITPDNTMILLS